MHPKIQLHHSSTEELTNRQSCLGATNGLSGIDPSCKPSYKNTLWRLSMVLLTLILMGVGFDTAEAQTQTRAYVAKANSANISVIDTTTNTVVGTIPNISAQNVAITPDGTRAYVTSQFDVSIIDAATNIVIAAVPNLVSAYGVAITLDGTRAYVTQCCASSGVVWAIDTSSNMVVATIPTGTSQGLLAITPDGTRVYLECSPFGYDYLVE